MSGHVKTPVEWVARLPHVEEVSLLGLADHALWRARLAPHGEVPIVRDGGAQILLVGARSRFMGVSFQELSVSVLLASRQQSDRTEDIYIFLAAAFTSVRFFAFCERTFFRTPYEHGNVTVSAGGEPLLRLARRGKAAFEARMGSSGDGAPRPSLREGEQRWAGRIFLPRERPGDLGRMFHAILEGEAHAFAFDPRLDSLSLAPPTGSPVLDALAASRFEPREWLVRPDGRHAKSTTTRVVGAMAAPLACLRVQTRDFVADLLEEQSGKPSHGGGVVAGWLRHDMRERGWECSELAESGDRRVWAFDARAGKASVGVAVSRVADAWLVEAHCHPDAAVPDGLPDGLRAICREALARRPEVLACDEAVQ